MGNLFKNRDNLRCGRVFCLSAAMALMLVALPSSAHAFHSFHAQIESIDIAPNKVVDAERNALVTNTPPSSVVDPCLPLLKSLHTSLSTTTDRNQRSAGKTANLGLVFGMRFALSPAPKTTARRSKARFGFWQPNTSSAGNRAALAVNSYEDCRASQAMDALNEFRWQR